MQGSIFIPDITGFTNFVNHIEIDLGVSIIKELLDEIIISNPLEVELSEIEGDAILYYKIGEPISFVNMFAGFKKISEAFDTRYNSLKARYGIEAPLSLKFIVHYGIIKVYDIRGFKSLYGETVIESHRLLKNGSGLSNYILITEDYFTALKQTASDIDINDLRMTYSCANLFDGLRKISYYFFKYLPNVINESLCLRA
jgi:Protein of unknown function (DUF2652)